MSAGLQWDGLSEFMAALRGLPEDLRAGVGPIVVSHAANAERDIRAAYPVRTGNLRDGMHLQTVNAGRFGAAAIVMNRAPHAGIFENGTQARHTNIGANRGSMPPGNIFVPIVMRERRALLDDLVDYLRKWGFDVNAAA